ncbi:hypothetical protein KFE25_004669 [Diacronema lutheri]|uniref:Nas2 N-terminal domain-containing protein n=1 Tax=Diacronema lutheri TaxID=2081491 RepID=A0A8J5XA53_DIALT|nr:hypothetical protein KFE25_004669 [Diacronema lutheri]
MADTASTEAQMKEELRSMMASMRQLEEEISQTVAALSAPGLGGLRGPLVDVDGFPRADVDVHGTRTLRNQHARLDTDHKALMAQIERRLVAMHALPAHLRAPAAAPKPQLMGAAATTAASPPQAGGGSGGDDVAMLDADSDDEAFALVDEVASGGPAECSGLRVGDSLVRFGTVGARTAEPLGAVARAVGAAEAASEAIELVVRRRAPPAVDELVRLTLRPQRWQGRGLLGCHLCPLAPAELTQ